MELFKDISGFGVIVAWVLVKFIGEIGKSIRINQLKKINNSKIESISQYEKNSKKEYLRPKNNQTNINNNG